MSSARRKTTSAYQILAGALLLMFAAVTPELLADQIVLKKDTPIKLRLVTSVSSETAKIGDLVELKVVEDVKINDLVVVPAGNRGRGFVAKAETQKLFGAGALNVYVGSVIGPSGLQIPVYGLCESTTNSGEATLSEGTETTALVDIDVPIDTDTLSKTPPKGK